MDNNDLILISLYYRCPIFRLGPQSLTFGFRQFPFQISECRNLNVFDGVKFGGHQTLKSFMSVLIDCMQKRHQNWKIYCYFVQNRTPWLFDCPIRVHLYSPEGYRLLTRTVKPMDASYLKFHVLATQASLSDHFTFPLK